MKKQYGMRKTITTVQELREFIAAMPGDVKLDLGFQQPVEICVMEDVDTGEKTLSLEWV